MVDLLKYLIIYRDDGIPIYTKCFLNYCSDAFKDPTLLTGFFSALENVSQELGEETPLKSIKVREITMIFKKTSPSRYSIVLGVKL